MLYVKGCFTYLSKTPNYDRIYKDQHNLQHHGGAKLTGKKWISASVKGKEKYDMREKQAVPCSVWHCFPLYAHWLIYSSAYL